MGPYWQQVQAVKDLGGEQNLQKFFLNTIKGDFDTNYQAYLTGCKERLLHKVL